MKMKTFLLASLALLPFVNSCMSTPLALAPVGPDASAQPRSSANGSLQVFSATQKSAPLASDDTQLFDLHTGYEVCSSAGQHLQYVANHQSNMDTSPDVVTLAPGRYNVLAQSTWCGMVTVPVVIQAGKTTVVHLDDNWFPSSHPQARELVFLPNGQAVGWSSPLANSGN
jgi:hypothetical protein